MSKQLAPVAWRPLVFDEKHCDNSCPFLDDCFCRLEARFDKLKGERPGIGAYYFIRSQACLDWEKQKGGDA